MRRRREGPRRPHLLHHPVPPEKGGLWAAGIFSLLLHITLIIFLTVGLKPTMTKMKPSFYRVTIRPYAPQGDGSPLGSSPAERPGPSVTKPAPPPVQKTIVEKIKPGESEKGRKTVEGLKSPQKKSEKKVVMAEKEDLSEKRKESLKNLHEELENIRRKAALEEIKKKILRREALEKEQAREASAGSQSQGAIASGSGTGTGSGRGTGPAGSPTGGSPWGSSSGGSALESRLSDYYDSIWAKIKKEWTLPENLPKGRTTLETTIVIVIDREGKIQKSWFERKSGNTLFDQRAMRAIKKAEPLPPIPKEFSDPTFEMGFRFHPD